MATVISLVSRTSYWINYRGFKIVRQIWSTKVLLNAWRHCIGYLSSIRFSTRFFCWCLNQLKDSHLISKIYFDHTKKARSLCSSSKHLLTVPKSKLKTFGDHAFSVCGPKLWNDLPNNEKTSTSDFKKKLKTHFFICAFEQWIIM